jgi:AcrR family transcriptional regulator
MARPSVAQARRPLILAAATRAIQERGFEAVRYVDVAEEAGVAVGTVQHYFASRDALLGAAFLEVNRNAVATARRAAGSVPVPPWRRLTLIVDQFTVLDRWGLWLEFWAAARHRDELRAVLEAVYGAWREPIVEAIEEGIASGDFRPRFTSGEIAGAFVALIDGLGIQRELGLDWLSPQRARDLVLGALGSALRVDPQPFP